MLATMTDKGQVTVPKDIRDRLGIAAGSKLDFEVQDDDTIRVRGWYAEPTICSAWSVAQG